MTNVHAFISNYVTGRKMGGTEDHHVKLNKQTQKDQNIVGFCFHIQNFKRENRKLHEYTFYDDRHKKT